MIHARRTTTVLTGLLAAGAVTLATPGLAQAATSDDTGAKAAVQRLDANRDKTVEDGDGQAQARVKATRQGRLLVSGKTEGGGSGTLGNQDTTADATAQVTGRKSAADGTYRVTINYKGIKGVDRDRNDGDADLNLRTTVQFQGPGDDGQTLRRTTELTSNQRNRTIKLTYKVPNGESGRIVINSALRGTSSSPSEGDRGRFSGSVQDVTYNVKRIGG